VTTAPTTTPRIGLYHASLMVMGGIIGVGIFYNPSKVAALSDSSAHALWLWALGGVAALCGAATFAELGARMPQAGGWYVYLREAVHPFVAWLFAWVVVGVISTGAIAVVLAIALQNFSALWPALGAPDTTSGRLTGSVLIVLITAVVAAGVQTGARLQSALMLLKIAAILALVGGAIWLSSTLDSAGSATPAADTVVREGSWLARSVQGMLPVLFTCGGWHMVSYMAHEVRDPRRTLPRAIVLGVVAVVALYLALVWGYLQVLGLEGVAASSDFAGQAATLCFGEAGGLILRAAMGISALGMVVVIILASPWLVVAMSRDGALPARVGALHPTTGAPVTALVLQACLALGYWWLGTADLLVESISFVEWIFHGLAAIALLRLRQRDTAGSFRGWRAPLVAPLLYLALAIAIVPGNLLALNLRAAGIGGTLLVLATLAWFVVRPSRA